MKNTSKLSIGSLLALLLAIPCRAENPIDHMQGMSAATEQAPANTREDIIRNALLHVYCKRNTENMALVARLLKPFSDAETQEFGNPMEVHFDISDDKEMEALDIQINPHVGTRANEETIPEGIAAWIIKTATDKCLAVYYQEQDKTSGDYTKFMNFIEVPENTSLDAYSQKYNAQKGKVKITIPFKKN